MPVIKKNYKNRKTVARITQFSISHSTPNPANTLCPFLYLLLRVAFKVDLFMRGTHTSSLNVKRKNFCSPYFTRHYIEFSIVVVLVASHPSKKEKKKILYP